MFVMEQSPTNATISRIGFIGNYSPRQCGIATFTTDLCEAIAAEYSGTTCIALPVNDNGAGYAYPARVRFELTEKDIDSYRRAADFLNTNNVDLVSLQHEYGIFGGDDGGYLLDFVYALRVPAVVTLHTVLKRPSENQAAIVRKMWERCEQLIVMSQIARDLLATSYGVSGSKVRIV